MNKKFILSLHFYGLLVFGIIGSGFLVGEELRYGSICPLLFGVPACYVILSCFLALLISHIFKLKNIYFYIINMVPIAIALYGSVFQVFGDLECPKTSSGIPMCFISLGIFSSIFILKYFLSKMKND